MIDDRLGRVRPAGANDLLDIDRLTLGGREGLHHQLHGSVSRCCEIHHGHPNPGGEMSSGGTGRSVPRLSMMPMRKMFGRRSSSLRVASMSLIERPPA